MSWIAARSDRAALLCWLVITAAERRSVLLDTALAEVLTHGRMSDAMEQAVRKVRERALIEDRRTEWEAVSRSTEAGGYRQRARKAAAE